MSNTEQDLSCLQVDALLIVARLELALGLQGAAARTSERQRRLQAAIVRRDQQADVIGARTRKERREDAAVVDAAGQAPTTAQVRFWGLKPCRMVCTSTQMQR